MKVAIVGSRPPSFDDQDWEWRVKRLVKSKVMDLDDDDIVVSGGARGVDQYAADAAGSCGLIRVVVHPAWVNRHGRQDKTAGFRRNSIIIDLADEVWAFWDGKSRGTKDSIDKARAAGKPVKVISI